jgi:hypothetical protein
VPDTEYFLAPAKGESWLPTREVIRRVVREFAFVQISKAEGKASLARQSEMLGRIFADPLLAEMSERLSGHPIEKTLGRRASKSEDAFVVYLSDSSPDDGIPFLQVSLCPGEVIGFGAWDAESEEVFLPLMHRFAKITGYEINEC